MKLTFLKTFGALLVAAGLTLAGVVAPAQASPLNVTIQTTGGATIATSGTTTAGITVNFTTVTAGADGFRVQSPNGWGATNLSTLCSTVIVNSPNNDPRTCSAYMGGTAVVVSIAKSTGTWSSSVPFSVEFPQGSLTAGSNRTWNASTTTSSGANIVDNGTATLAGGVSNATVTFDANGGTGTTAAQTASSATALTSNAFTRSGYTFAGWNTAANGTGTSYADGASYAFSSSTTLYAQWTSSLANTGFNGMPWLAAGNALGVLGVAVLLISARRRQNG